MGWTQTVTPADCNWIGRYVFNDAVGALGNLKDNLKLWYFPPSVPATISKKPEPQFYFLRRLCFWLPHRLFKYNFKCPIPGCNKNLTSKGIYTKVRLVLDVEDYYYLATENLKCNCGKLTTILGWDNRLLAQLPYAL